MLWFRSLVWAGGGCVEVRVERWNSWEVRQVLWAGGGCVVVLVERWNPWEVSDGVSERG